MAGRLIIVSASDLATQPLPFVVSPDVLQSLFNRLRREPATAREPGESTTQPAARPGVTDPKTLAAIQELELVSRHVVDGFYSGRHRSAHQGGCCEFAQHRPYTPGDELRRIDWQIYARRDRYYVRQFEQETNLQALLVVDSSGSMKFGMSTPSKLEFARRAAACLSRLLLRQRDAAGLIVAGDSANVFIPPRRKPSHMRVILESLAAAEARGATQLSRQLRDCGSRLARRGMILIFSDCFDEVDRLAHALRYLRARGHETVLFHILAPEEVTFQFRHWSSFKSLEADQVRIDVDPAAIRAEYLRRFAAFLTAIQSTVAATGGDYVRVQTDDDLATVLAYYLRRRAASARGQSPWPGLSKTRAAVEHGPSVLGRASRRDSVADRGDEQIGAVPS
jgi:uncharacterized protein (DUF58 family)